MLQRINQRVFPDPIALIENIKRVTHHVEKGLAGEFRSLELVPSRAGPPYVKSASGEVWRVYRFIDRCVSYAVVETPERANEVARAFGHFQRCLSTMEPDGVYESIRDFHDTPKRFSRFASAVSLDRFQRAATARREIEFAYTHESLTSVLLELHRAGLVPQRICHNDAKLDNVLFDQITDRAVCVIDLDTVMPGLSLYDFGDLVRSCTSTATEDETDGSTVEVKLELFQGLAAGYLDATRNFLTPAEIDHLGFAGNSLPLKRGCVFSPIISKVTVTSRPLTRPIISRDVQPNSLWWLPWNAISTP